MLYNLKRKLNRSWYNLNCRAIFDTEALKIREAPLLFLTMVSHDDLLMYLVAIKSLYARIGEGSIAVINDGSLTPDDIDRLNYHLGCPEILDVRCIETSPCPRGGCWERLLTAMDRCADNYLIQVDSDTLTLAAVPEVIEAYRNNRSFTLGTSDGQSIVSLSEALAVVEKSTSNHVQVVAERCFVNFLDGEWRYVRGCAGFAGFARGRYGRADAEAWSRRMQEAVGEKWSEWGSEQVTSNLLIANASDSVVLPYPRYTNFGPMFDLALDPAQSAFLHFIGTYRYLRGIYRAESRRFIAESQSAQAGVVVQRTSGPPLD